MTASLTLRETVEARCVERYADKLASDLVSGFGAALKEFFPHSYDNPFGQLPPVVVGALEVVQLEVREAAIKQGKDKLIRAEHTAIMEALNAQ